MKCKQVLESIKNGTFKIIDTSVRGASSIPSAFAPMCIDSFIEDLLYYVSLKPKNYTVDNGLKLSYYLDTHTARKPVRVYSYGDHIYTADEDANSVYQFDKNFNLMLHYKTNANIDNRNIKCLAMDDDNIYYGTYYNRLVAISKETKEVIWEFGTFNSRGKCSDGKIGKVVQIDILSNGNLMVGTSDGAGDRDRYYGTLEEFDKDGNWIKTHLQNISTGEGVDMETDYVRSIKVYNDIVYVGKRDTIDVFSYDTESRELSFVQTIRKPRGSNVDDLDLSDFVIVDNVLYVVSGSLKKVVGFNLVTGEIEFASGLFSFEAYSGTDFLGNGLNSPSGICVVDGKIYVADQSNRSVKEIFRDNYIYPKYELPQNMEVISSSAEFREDGTVPTPVGSEPPNLQIVYREKIKEQELK